jgi:hypothetical protein
MRIGKIPDEQYSTTISNLARLGWWVEAGVWRHKRIEQTMHAMIQKREKKISAGLQGANARWGAEIAAKTDSTPNGKPIAQPLANEKQSDGNQNQNHKEKRETPADPRLSILIRDLFQFWNDTAVLPRCLVVSDKRRRVMSARFKDEFFNANWKQAIERCRKSSFCCGENDRGWKASLDWFIQADVVAKIMEGKYDNKSAVVPKKNLGYVPDAIIK